MELLFTEPGVKNGHVIFKTEGRSAVVEVSEGRGSATRTHIFKVQAEIPPPAYDTNYAVRLCRIAIAKFLKNRGVFASISYIDERAEPWHGTLQDVD